ncbi:hypothetical protein C0991_000469 [Blastosporella zonata]|nr:hypothetical protein C0991_000469 [Blastosporella zonata]
MACERVPLHSLNESEAAALQPNESDTVPLSNEESETISQTSDDADAKTLSIWTHIAWWIFHIYLPLSQWIWFAKHYKIANTLVFFARASAIGTQLGLPDFKTRVILAVETRNKFRIGHFIALFMAFTSPIIRLSLAGLMSMEFVIAAHRYVKAQPSMWGLMLVFYIIMSCLPLVIFIVAIQDIMDVDGFAEKWKRETEYPWVTRFFTILIACAGPFLFCFLTLGSDNGLSISQYLKCASPWDKFSSLSF